MADRTNGLNNIDIGSGRRGFRNRNLGLGQAGTVVDAEWANGLQEEVVRLIELLGIAPSAANREQLIHAIRRLAGGNVTSFAANTTLTADHAGVVLVSAAAGSLMLTLPAAASAGAHPIRLTIIRTDTTANTVTLARAGSDTIEGATSWLVPVGDRLTLAGDGASTWRRVATEPGPRGSQNFLSSGSFVVPSGVFRLRCKLWGGGGGGGGSANIGNSGSGGAGGGYAEGIFSVTPGQVIPVTIGAGGTLGTSAGANGGPGGTTSFGALASAPGGTGGNSALSGQAVGAAAGALPSGGQINLPGQPTANAYLIGSSAVSSGGGAAPFGGAGTGPSGAAGLIPGFPGGGAGGGANGFNGATGAPGFLIVEW